jgi:undecaprenyl diphosphate synthase
MNLLTHVAIIPDGNRRWAKARNVPAMEGHRYSFEEVLPSLLEKAADLGIKYFTFWAMSTENRLKRSVSEVEGLFSLGKLFYAKRLNEFVKRGIRLQFIGDTAQLSPEIRSIMKDSAEKTKNNTKITLVIALNYGGRDEVIRALQKVNAMNFLAKSVNKDNFGQFLDTNGIPDPDLIIRTGGEKRLSGFMLWQSEYSELYFSDLFFPDFSPKELEKAVDEFNNRKRNFGK